MPRLPHLSGREIIRVLERLGFKAVRQNGSHVVMRSGSRGCVVPLHKPVMVGTLAGLLRQAQVMCTNSWIFFEFVLSWA